MATGHPAEHFTDRWARWLLQDRFGGDEERRRVNISALERFRDRVLTAARIAPGDIVLDVGCGDGLIGFGAIPLLGDAGRVVFTDISDQLLERCRQIASDLDVADRCQFISSPAETLEGIDDSSVDVVATRSVLIYVDEKASAFEAFWRVLRPGGRLLASVPGALSPIYRASWMRHLPGGDPGNNYLLPWELENLLLEYGWRVIDGWGEWGDDLYGTVNDTASSLRRAERGLQQATATTWTTIAV